MLTDLDSFMKEAETFGFTASKPNGGIFRSKDGIEYGITLGGRDQVSVNSVYLYNSEMLDAVFDIIGLKKPKSIVRRVTLGNSSSLFFLTGEYSNIVCPPEPAAFKRTIETIHTELAAKASDLDVLFGLALKERDAAVREKKKFRADIFEILANISVCQGRFKDAVDFCEAYYEFCGISKSLGSSMVRDLLAYANGKLV